MFGKVFCEFSKCISRWNTYIRRKNKRSDEFSRKNLDEETMLKKLRKIRVRDNLPMRWILLRWKERLDYSEKFRG